MADYLRQLSNDEKRSRFIVVATVTGEDLVGPLDPIVALAVSALPKGSITGKVYAVVTKPFAAGSLLTWGIADVSGAMGALTLLTDLDLATVGVTRTSKFYNGISINGASIAIVPNTAAFDSVVGEVKLVMEISEPRVKSGKYSA